MCTITVMAVQLVAWVRERGTGATDETQRQSFRLEVEADTYEEAKRCVHAQLEPGWLVGSWRVVA